MTDTLNGIRAGWAMCGSFCTFERSFSAMEQLSALGAEITVIMSFNSAEIDSRFGTAAEHTALAEKISGRPVIRSIAEAEPIGPRKMFDILICAPCTGNTAAKLCAGITDTPVTMAVKSHLRGGLPVLLAFSTNDALTASAKNIAELLNRKNYYFVPVRQDDPLKKPASAAADLSLLPRAALEALNGRQLQPLLLAPLGTAAE